ncbi:hypothetical protein MmiEs2_07420 [Methanimicrococcus stummii]|uniref:Uncharacterized protein n=2 Tax=Methanimicrococcus stummii TaxID=3028294 RepID=A0AA96ZX55_9EURY|nr:hypothetical protein MmiEs2_07420 [Methanimicrococcus sp. Es2]
MICAVGVLPFASASFLAAARFRERGRRLPSGLRLLLLLSGLRLLLLPSGLRLLLSPHRLRLLLLPYSLHLPLSPHRLRLPFLFLMAAVRSANVGAASPFLLAVAVAARELLDFSKICAKHTPDFQKFQQAKSLFFKNSINPFRFGI